MSWLKEWKRKQSEARLGEQFPRMPEWLRARYEAEHSVFVMPTRLQLRAMCLEIAHVTDVDVIDDEPYVVVVKLYIGWRWLLLSARRRVHAAAKVVRHKWAPVGIQMDVRLRW